MRTEEPGVPQPSKELQRIRHNLATEQQISVYFLQKTVFILNEIFLLFAFSVHKWKIYELLIYRKIFAGLELTPRNH